MMLLLAGVSGEGESVAGYALSGRSVSYPAGWRTYAYHYTDVSREDLIERVRRVWSMNWQPAVES